MKVLHVDVCTCAECVMNGCMDIVDAIESLKKLKSDVKIKTQIIVSTKPCVGDALHYDKSPIVSVGKKIIEHANAQTVMSQIMELTSKDVKRS